ncbi:MAG: peptidase E [bacterium]|nr:peptidase E [bacterium]
MGYSQEKRPKLLFIPTASSDSAEYVKVVEKYFGIKLGCKIDVLYLVNRKTTKKEIKNKIFNSDIIYVGGGNTLKMMNVWRRTGVDKILKQAYGKGIVLSGLSAGAICWFKYGHSDSSKFKNKNAAYIKVKGLGLLDFLCCPHYDVEKGRNKSLKKIMKKEKISGIALDNCAALEVINNKYRILTSKRRAGAYKFYWKRGEYYEEKIENKGFIL